MDDLVDKSLLDRLMSPTTMMDAEAELLSRGAECVPVIAAILDGSATNQFGVPYGRLGLPRRCAQEMASRLGSVAKPLEYLLAQDVADGHFPAAMALGRLGSLEKSSVAALAANIGSDDWDLASESAIALVRCGHVDTARAAATTERTSRLVAEAQQYLLQHKSQ